MSNRQLHGVGLVSGLIKLNNAAGMAMQTTSCGRKSGEKSGQGLSMATQLKPRMSAALKYQLSFAEVDCAID